MSLLPYETKPGEVEWPGVEVWMRGGPEGLGLLRHLYHEGVVDDEVAASIAIRALELRPQFKYEYLDEQAAKVISAKNNCIKK